MGKHTLAREMCPQIRTLKMMCTITTRARRLSDRNEEMIFVSREVFNKRLAAGEFFYVNRKKDISYAYSKIELVRKTSRECCAILVFHSKGALALKKRVPGIPTIFVEAPLGVLVARCKNRGDWEENRYNELVKSISINQKAYRLFKTREQNCIRLKNGNNTSPMVRSVVERALAFYRRINVL